MNKEEIKSMLFSLHHSTFRNEQQIKNSQQCGCFHLGAFSVPRKLLIGVTAMVGEIVLVFVQIAALIQSSVMTVE